MEVLNSIPANIELKDVLKLLRLRNNHEHVTRTVQELIELVHSIANPKAIYEVSYVENKNEDSLYIGGIQFTSRVLRVNLDKVERVFPYVATCGRELETIVVPPDDVMKSYYLDTIKHAILNSARNYLEDYLMKNYALGKLSRMNPGSLEDWPITQQKELFSIFGSVEDFIGVKLTESLVMQPLKSVSGIFFPTEIKFESCQLCPREVCIGRRAAYDPNLVRKYREKNLG